MQSNPNATDQTDALRSAISDGGPDPVLLVWIRHRPRITTMRPVAEHLASRGYRVFVAYSTSLEATPESMGFGPDIACFELRPANVKTLKNVAIFIGSEQDTREAPVDSKRIGIHHSMPDRSLRRNYANILAMKPVAIIETDYYAVLSTQTKEHWTVENYLPHVDRQFPPNLLAQRRPSLAIIPFGYPKIDRMLALDPSEDTLDTITYAPTQTIVPYGSVMQKGKKVLSMLLRSFPNHRIAFRPYPGLDVKRTRKVYEEFLDNPRFSLDDSPTGEALMRRTKVMVSDRSSVAVSFGLGMARPVVFLESGATSKPGGKRLEYFAPIGLRAIDVPALRDGVIRVLNNSAKIAERINAQRENHIYNPGRSLEYLGDVIPDILSGGSRPEWLEIPRRPFMGKTEAELRAQYDVVMAKVAAAHPKGVPANEAALKAGFEPAENALRQRLRSAAAQIVQNTPGLRRYRSRPTDPS